MTGEWLSKSKKNYHEPKKVKETRVLPSDEYAFVDRWTR
jgi:hypothetical protein